MPLNVDTIFRDPMATIKDGIFKGACDNFAGVCAVAQLFNNYSDDLIIEFTYDEEVTMDGAQCVAREHDQSDTLFIVVDVTKKKRSWADKVKFTVENVSGIDPKHIRRALKKYKGVYKIQINGDESEAWLYRKLGFCTIEVDVPVEGGLHNLDSKAKVEDIVTAGEAMRELYLYFKDKTKEEVGGDVNCQ